MNLDIVYLRYEQLLITSRELRAKELVLGWGLPQTPRPKTIPEGVPKSVNNSFAAKVSLMIIFRLQLII
jgi:hypothetical protein